MRRAGPRTARGFTLIELTLSIALLVTLTVVLFGFLRGGMGMYRSGEGRRDTYERAQILLDDFARELGALAAPVVDLQTASPAPALLADRDDHGRPRIRFLRSLGEERTDAVLRLAGTRPGATRTVDGVEDLREARDGELLAPGGRMEVAYLRAPGPSGDGTIWLYRAVRAPVGGPGSLFDDAVLPAGEEPPGPPFLPLDGGILHLGFRFRGMDGQGNPFSTEIWDSTRGRMKDFERHRGPASLADPRDDVMPGAIEVELVLEEPGSGEVRLTRGVSDADTVLPVTSTKPLGLDKGEGLVLVEGEWMRVAVADTRTLKLTERGLHGSDPARHPERARVRVGVTFRRFVEVPVRREVWDE